MVQRLSFMGGMSSAAADADDQEIYFFALTDFFTEYGAALKFSNFFASSSDQLSAIEPVAFADRLASLVEARTK
jgi:hypothetical protein